MISALVISSMLINAIVGEIAYFNASACLASQALTGLAQYTAKLQNQGPFFAYLVDQSAQEMTWKIYGTTVPA
jgi:hypothetical protein